MALVGTLLAAIVPLAVLIVMIMALWRINTKAGRPGWHNLIPFLAQYTQADMGGNTKNFWVFLIASGVSGLFSGAGSALAFAQGEFTTAALLITMTSLPAVLVALIMYIKIQNGISRAFGQGTGFTVGMILLPVVFYAILGFGKSEYNGEIPEGIEKPKKEKTPKAPKPPKEPKQKKVKEPKPAKAPKEKKVKTPKGKRVEEAPIEDPIEEEEQEQPRITMDQKMFQSLKTAANKPKPIAPVEEPVIAPDPEPIKPPQPQNRFKIQVPDITEEQRNKFEAEFPKSDYLVPAFIRAKEEGYQPPQPPAPPVMEEPIAPPVVEEPVAPVEAIPEPPAPAHPDFAQQNPFEFSVPAQPDAPVNSAPMKTVPSQNAAQRASMDLFWDDDRYAKPAPKAPVQPEPPVYQPAPQYVQPPAHVSEPVVEKPTSQPIPTPEFVPQIVVHSTTNEAIPGFSYDPIPQAITQEEQRQIFPPIATPEIVHAPVQQTPPTPVYETPVYETPVAPMPAEQPVVAPVSEPVETPVFEAPQPAPLEPELPPVVEPPRAPLRFIDPKPVVEQPKVEDDDEELPPPPVVPLPPKKSFFSRNKSTAIDRFHNEDGGLK